MLKQQVHGRGSILLDSIDNNNQNFQSAKDILMKAFANQVQVRQCVIEQISELQLKDDNEPFEYIGKITNLNNAVNDFEIESAHILEYFIWHGLNNKFKKELVNITNNNRPSLNEMLNNFFIVAERYNSFKMEKNENNFQLKDGINAFASDIKQDYFDPLKHCILCQSKNHSLSRCSEFPEPFLKVRKLKSINACLSCARLGHISKNCKFVFKFKCNCGYNHFQFLCLNQNNPKLGKTFGF